MKIGIIGPGALGCLFASRLFLAVATAEQHKVLLIDHNASRADRLNCSGIIYETEDSRQHLNIPVNSCPEDVGILDVLFSCVKSYDIEESLRFAAPLTATSTLLVFLQNGISHLNYSQMPLSATPVFATSSEGATLLAPGHVKHAGRGQTYLGFYDSGAQQHNSHLYQVLALLQKGGISSSVSSDICSRIWAKLLINVGINALTAIHNRSNGFLLTSPGILTELKALVLEATRVAEAMGITIREDPVQATISVCKNTAANISSMLQDVRAGRATEIDAINGAVTMLGRKLGIATPYNDAIVARIRSIQEHYQ